MAKKVDFSVVIPTYSGVSTINRTFDSILKQNRRHNYELIIVIDGPNNVLAKVCTDIKPSFEKLGIPIAIEQFKQNRGRFIARLEGAKLATTNQLLFIDDRVAVENDYFSQLLASGSLAAMPNVIEVEDQPRLISMTMRQLRKWLYPGKWGDKFADHYVDYKNFEKLPKGTTSLWIPRDVFVNACQRLTGQRRGDSKYTNDDTRILKVVVDSGTKIFRSSKLTIYYHPRSDFQKEVWHLFGRGTIFVDYYSKPGTRLFPVFVGIYLILIGLIITVFVWLQFFTTFLALVLLGLLIFSIIITGLSKKHYLYLWGCC